MEIPGARGLIKSLRRDQENPDNAIIRILPYYFIPLLSRKGRGFFYASHRTGPGHSIDGEIKFYNGKIAARVIMIFEERGIPQALSFERFVH